MASALDSATGQVTALENSKAVLQERMAQLAGKNDRLSERLCEANKVADLSAYPKFTLIIPFAHNGYDLGQT